MTLDGVRGSWMEMTLNGNDVRLSVIGVAHIDGLRKASFE